jgi:hypothetical protein
LGLSGVIATDGEGEGVVNAALPAPCCGVSGWGAKKRDHPMKITADRIRNKISLFSIYKLVCAAPLDYALRRCPDV